jgi:hypothetical protein
VASGGLVFMGDSQDKARRIQSQEEFRPPRGNKDSARTSIVPDLFQQQV